MLANPEAMVFRNAKLREDVPNSSNYPTLKVIVKQKLKLTSSLSFWTVLKALEIYTCIVRQFCSYLDMEDQLLGIMNYTNFVFFFFFFRRSRCVDQIGSV